MPQYRNINLINIQCRNVNKINLYYLLCEINSAIKIQYYAINLHKSAKC
jgi:hypothetical protein